MDLTTAPALLQQAQIWAADYGLRLLAALALYLVGRWCARLVKRVVVQALTAARMDTNLIAFAGNLSYYGLLAFTVLAMLGQLGIATTSLLAVMGAAGLAVGLALQGSLTNFAAGLLIVFFHPFRVGDTIEGAGVTGVVEDIQLLTTAVRMGDNRLVTIPNSSLTGGNVINCSAMTTTYVDLSIPLPRGADVGLAKATIRDIIAADRRVLVEPAPVIGLVGLGEQTLTLGAQLWVRPEDAAGVRAATLELIAHRLLAADAQAVAGGQRPEGQQAAGLRERLPASRAVGEA